MAPFMNTHCKQDPIYVFPEMKFAGLVPSLHIHVFVSDLYNPTIGSPIFLGGPICDII